MEGDRQISTIYATIEWNCGAAQHGKGPPDLAAVRPQVLTVSSSESESVAVVFACKYASITGAQVLIL